MNTNCNCGCTGRCKNKGSNGGGGGAGTVLFWGNSSLQSGAGVEYLDPGYSGSPTSTAPTFPRLRAPRGGTLRNLLINQIPATGTVIDVTYTLRINGVASALSVTIPSDQAQGQITVSVSVPFNALIDLEVTHPDFAGVPPQAVTATSNFT